MKIKSVFLLCVCCFVIGSVRAQSEIDSSYANGYYVKKMEEFRKQPPVKSGWVFIGNSITEAGHWDKRWAQYRAIDRGISGDNSFGVKNRIEEALRHQPEKVMVMIGVNDLKRGTPVKAIKKNYEAIVKQLYRNPGKPEVYLQSVLPVQPVGIADIYKRIRNKDVRQLNKYLKKLARRYAMHYVDLYTVFADKRKSLRKGLDTDKLHLSEKGYELWEETLRRAMNQ